MDDALEKPSSSFDILNRPTGTDDDGARSEDEDDGAPDWTRFAAANASKPYIPKRGDKEHEPAGGVKADGSGLQQHKLERARDAMYGAIDIDRVASSKTMNHAIWLPQQSRARLIRARGNFMNTMGYSVSVDPQQEDGKASSLSKKKVEKAVELLPEEALYLVERGSMLCWSQLDRNEDDLSGTPMSVQQAHAQMIGCDGLSIEKFQVYAYLKRLGYTVIRSPFSDLDRGPKTFSSRSLMLLEGLLPVFKGLISALLSFVAGGRRHNWWSPIGCRGLHRLRSQSVFSALRFLHAGYGEGRSRTPSSPTVTENSPYNVSFRVYKPSTPYRKTAPPSPDFHIVVVNARETLMPSLSEFCELFEALPDVLPPKPREKAVTSHLSSSKPASPVINKSPNGPREVPATTIRSLQSPLSFIRCLCSVASGGKEAPRRLNPFQMLKMGKRMIVVAAVDNGVISFYRFGQGAFEEWPMQ